MPHLLDRLIFGLELEPARLAERAPPSALVQLVARSLRLAAPSELGERERRLIHLAESVAPSGEDRATRAGFQDAFVLVCVLAHGWAVDESAPRATRDAALAACVALAACIDPDARQVHGIKVRLAAVGRRTALDAEARRLARQLAKDVPVPEGEAFRVLSKLIEELESPRPARRLPRRKSRSRSRRP